MWEETSAGPTQSDRSKCGAARADPPDRVERPARQEIRNRDRWRPGPQSVTCRCRMGPRCAEAHARQSAHGALRKASTVSWDFLEGELLDGKNVDRRFGQGDGLTAGFSPDRLNGGRQSVGRHAGGMVSLLEEHFQVGRQIDDKVLRDSVPDKRAGELAIEEVRCFYPAPKQHHCERTI